MPDESQTPVLLPHVKPLPTPVKVVVPKNLRFAHSGVTVRQYTKGQTVLTNDPEFVAYIKEISTPAEEEEKEDTKTDNGKKK